MREHLLQEDPVAKRSLFRLHQVVLEAQTGGMILHQLALDIDVYACQTGWCGAPLAKPKTATVASLFNRSAFLVVLKWASISTIWGDLVLLLHYFRGFDQWDHLVCLIANLTLVMRGQRMLTVGVNGGEVAVEGMPRVL